jgi:hypothetical protein
LKPPSFIYAASRAEKPRKLAKFAPSSETWVSGLGSQPALEDSAEKVLLAFEMAEKGDFVETSSSSDLERGSALNTVPVQGLGRSVQESLACLIGGRRDEPIAYKLRS